MNKKILLVGAGGQLGGELITSCPDGFEILAMAHGQLDITDLVNCRGAVNAVRPDWIINAAAYTNVEKAEDEPEEALRVNGDGPANLAIAAEEAGVRLLHISTDFVFDGTLRRPYQPDDQPNPLSSYGRSKLAGEKAVQKVLGSDALIIRTSWLYSLNGKNFMNTILRLLREQSVLRIVADQAGAPTSTISLAAAIFAALASDCRGLHHWSDGGVTTWHEFACEIQNQALARQIIKEQKEIQPISSSEFKCKAIRPAWSVLDKTSFIALTGMIPASWQDMLGKTLSQKIT